MTFRTLDDAGDVLNQRALVRVDLNVPMQDGRVTDDTRLQATVATVRRLRDMQAKVILLAHFERPKGKRVPEMSLRAVVQPLSDVLGVPVAFAEDCVGPEAAAAIERLGRLQLTGSMLSAVNRGAQHGAISATAFLVSAIFGAIGQLDGI